MFLPDLLAPLLEYRPLVVFAVPLGFALLVRRWVPRPVEASAPGPAREFLAGAGALILALALAVPVVQVLAAPDRSARLPTALLWVPGLSFLAGLFFNQVARPWLRQGKDIRSAASDANGP
jgi:hypothetical protein